MQWKHCFPSNETNFFFSVYFKFTTKRKHFYCDSNASFSKRKRIQSYAKAFNFCRVKKNLQFGASVIHLRVTCEAFPCFNLLEQNYPCNLFSACVLIYVEVVLVGAFWIVCCQNKSFNFEEVYFFFLLLEEAKDVQTWIVYKFG